jgi:hypothetical protein
LIRSGKIFFAPVLNIRSQKNETPPLFATEYDRPGIVKILLAIPIIEVNISNNASKTAMSIATELWKIFSHCQAYCKYKN